MTTDSPMDRLEALGGLVEEIDGANPGHEAQAAAQAEEKQATEHDAAAKAWGMIPFALGGALSILAPELRQVYTEEACYGWGQGAAAVSRKYGWDSPGELPELALIVSTIGLALPSYVAIRAKVEEVKDGKATGLLARLGIWWRARKAARAAAKAAPGEGVGAAVPAAAGATA